MPFPPYNDQLANSLEIYTNKENKSPIIFHNFLKFHSPCLFLVSYHNCIVICQVALTVPYPAFHYRRCCVGLASLGLCIGLVVRSGGR